MQEPMKSPGVAAVLSVVWGGLGQIYNGQIGKGLGIMVFQIINVVLTVVLIGYLLFAIVWIWNIYDAYSTAEAINRRARE